MLRQKIAMSLRSKGYIVKLFEWVNEWCHVRCWRSGSKDIIHVQTTSTAVSAMHISRIVAERIKFSRFMMDSWSSTQSQKQWKLWCLLQDSPNQARSHKWHSIIECSLCSGWCCLFNLGCLAVPTRDCCWGTERAKASSCMSSEVTDFSRRSYVLAWGVWEVKRYEPVRPSQNL